MAIIYVEPRPKGYQEGTAIADYVLELAGVMPVVNIPYKTQAEAIAAAKRRGHQPMLACVRSTDKGNPDHWRAV